VAQLEHLEEGSPSIEGVDTIFGNPLLDPSYRLNFTSAAIDAGADSGITTDIDGDLRPQGQGYDIGCDEYSGRWVYLPVVTR
jgi:hypothetical protein